MPEVTFVGNAPTPAEFRQALAEAMSAANPIDDLLMLAGRLGEYERKYRMPSANFALRYQDGKLDDEMQHCIEWAATYDLFVKTKRVVEATLMRAAVKPELDDSPHHPHLSTFPHHKHTGDSIIEAAVPDLADVLREIDALIYVSPDG